VVRSAEQRADGADRGETVMEFTGRRGIVGHAELRRSPRGNYRMVMPALSPRYTVDMLDAMTQDPGARYELLDGFLIVTPPPGQVHAVVAAKLIVALATAIPRSAARVAPPGEIRIGDSTSLQPDILVYPSNRPLGEPWRNVT
jgi:Uma2 family endonuclease